MSTQENSGQSLFIKRLVANIECANCGTRYELGNISIAHHRDDLWIAFVVCVQCGTEGLIFAMVSEDGTPEVISRDASPEELREFEKLSTLGIDDVLDMHRFLEGYDGDLVSLLHEADAYEP